MPFRRVSSRIALLALLAGCSAPPGAPPSDGGETPEPMPAAEVEPVTSPSPEASADCPVSATSNWVARLRKLPGADGKVALVIAGDVTLPTPGWKASWREGPADRAMPPAQYFDVSFERPDGMVAQVITTERISYQADARYPAYRKIVIRCGSRVLAEIGDVGDSMH